MLIAGALMWKVLDEHFEIADNINTVICYSCVMAFTIATSILVVGSTVVLLTFIGFFAAKLHKFNFGIVLIAFYTLALVIAIVIVITTPIWLERQSNVVQRFEDSSEVTFRKQIRNAMIRDIWDNYQERFGCCGIQNYRDYRTYFGDKYSIPLSCCNLTTLLQADINCSAVIKDVTEEAVSSYYIYGKGCPVVIISTLRLNSTTVRNVGIAAAVASFVILVSIIGFLTYTMIAVPESKKQCYCLMLTILCTLYAICGALGDDD